jgi:hypothetical protein
VRGLATASVVVIDNDPEDALPLIKAFSSAGVGAIYLSGDRDEFPDASALRGIRLIALDIHLTNLDMSDEQTVRQPVQVLQSIIERGNGPYLVLLWTSRPELAELFRRYVKDIEWPPVMTCVLGKDKVRDDEGGFSLELIVPEVMAGIREANPLQALMLWGQAVHDAASATLASLGPDSAADWMAGVGSLLGALIRENTPRAALSDPARCMMALFGALDQVFTDQLEVATAPIAAQKKDCIAGVATKALASSSTDAQLMSRINRSLLLGPVTDKTGAPGSVYILSELATRFQDEMGGLVADTLLPPKSDWKKPKKEVHEAATVQSIPIAVELTPVCDYQQGRNKVVRLLGGIAVPVDLAKEINKDADHVRIFPSISFAEGTLSGDYVLAWNSHFLVARRHSVLSQHYPPAYRVRQAPLSDLITFHANYSARPGYLAVRH